MSMYGKAGRQKIFRDFPSLEKMFDKFACDMNSDFHL